MKPYQPPLSQGFNLPAQRYVIYADDEGSVWHINEASSVIGGTWDSPDLVRLRGSAEQFNPVPGVWTLHKLLLSYIATEDSVVSVSFSVNGGEIWKSERTVRLSQTRGGTSWKLIQANVTGPDIRFRIEFHDNELVKIVGYRPAMSLRANQPRVGR